MAKDSYATKADLKRLEQNLEKEIIDSKNEIVGTKNEIINMKVEVLGELQKMREDDAAHKFSHIRIDDDLIEHDNRLKKVENSMQI